MIPVGGVYTINGSEAKKVVAQIKPKEYIFPMHRGTRVFDDLLPATEFLDGQDKAKVAESADNKVTLNRDRDRPRPLIVTLTYPPEAKGKRPSEAAAFTATQLAIARASAKMPTTQASNGR